MWWVYTIPELKEQMQLDDHDPGNPNLIPRKGDRKLDLIRRWFKYGDPQLTDDFERRKQILYADYKF